MKAIAKVIRGSVKARATTTNRMLAVAYAMPQGIQSRAETTEQTGLLRFLHVTPEEPQQLVWLVPQYGIDYTVTTSRNLKWQIK